MAINRIGTSGTGSVFIRQILTYKDSPHAERNQNISNGRSPMT